jgi:hypothetical protein
MAGMPYKERGQRYIIPEKPPEWFAGVYTHFRMQLETVRVAIDLRSQGKNLDLDLIAEQLQVQYNYSEELAQTMSDAVPLFVFMPEIDFSTARERLRNAYEQEQKGFWTESLLHEEIEDQRLNFLSIAVKQSIKDESQQMFFLVARTYFQSVIELVIKGQPLEKAIRTLEFSGFENNIELLDDTQLLWPDWLGLREEPRMRIEEAVRPVVEEMCPNFFILYNLVEAHIKAEVELYRLDRLNQGFKSADGEVED